jgi:PKD repeat protein
MYLFNVDDNVSRTNYYGVNGVPAWIINGEVMPYISPYESENIPKIISQITDTVNTGNAEFSPFKIILCPIYYSSNILRVHVKIIRDGNDNTNPEDLRLRVAITEKTISYTSPPGSNGESEFFSVCRKMLPNDTGTSFETPAKGDSSEFYLEFLPDEEFISMVDVNNLRVVAFIQNDTNKEMFQSEMEDVVFVSQLEALFEVAEHIGVSPFSVTFSNYSTSTDSTSITKYEWDFNGDGIVDSEVQEPTWVFAEEGSYDVSLTVKDGIEEFTRITPNFIHVLGNTSDILVVNGINYAEYSNEMNDFYNNSVCFAGNEVDIWDLYGVQDFNFSSNEKVKRAHLFSQHIPTDVLNLYEKVIWIGDHHMGVTIVEIGDQIVEYVNQGGNFLLATNNANEFFNDNLKDYCGVSRFSPNSSVSGITAFDPNLVDLTVTATNTNIQFARLTDSTNAKPIFTRIASDSWIAGFTFHKNGNGGFIYVGGSPFMYDNNSTAQNFDYIISNWLRQDPTVSIENEKPLVINKFSLNQNYPNPFNHSTTIKYSIPSSISLNGTDVKLIIFDILGKEIVTLVDQNMQAGNYETNFDATNLSSGIYYYKLTASNFIETKKMIFLK